MMSKAKMRADEGFIVHHFAGSVLYSVDGFLEKNDNKINEPFDAKLRASPQLFLKSMFSEEGNHQPRFQSKLFQSSTKMDLTRGMSSVSLLSVGKVFVSDLKGLMKELSHTEPQFLRCLKPNNQ